MRFNIPILELNTLDGVQFLYEDIREYVKRYNSVRMPNYGCFNCDSGIGIEAIPHRTFQILDLTLEKDILMVDLETFGPFEKLFLTLYKMNKVDFIPKFSFTKPSISEDGEVIEKRFLAFLGVDAFDKKNEY